jgi:subtilisin family serine protease
MILFFLKPRYRLLMRALELVDLSPLMARTSGRPEISVRLIDGPVLLTHPELSSENIREISGGNPLTFGGTSVAAPFVTGAFALLWSEFPVAPAAELLLAARGTRRLSRVGIVPPLLDAWLAHQVMLGRGYTVESKEP